MSSFSGRELRCRTSYDPKTKIWSGIKTEPFFGPECTLGGEILKSCFSNPQKIVQICHHNGKQYTNDEIAKLTVSVAEQFKRLRIAQCEIIGVVAGNTDYLAPLVFGAWLCGLIISPLEPNVDKEIIKQAYNITKPIMVFTVGSAYEKVKECLNDLNLQATIYTLNEHIRGVPEIKEFFQKSIGEHLFKPEPLKYGWNQTAAILRSSGSTGTPKAVCISHNSLLNTYRPKCNPDDIFLGNTTIYWITGLRRLIDTCLFGVTNVINEKGFQASMMHEIMQKYKVSIIYASPPLLANLLEEDNINSKDFLSLRQFRTGGCNVPNALIEKAKALMPNTEFHIVYGSSETNGIVSDGLITKAKHSGQLTSNRELKIIDDDGRSLGPGETGEICIRNSFPWAGYYKNPQLTTATYKDGWIHTSDLGYVDEEGNLYIVERKNDVIKYKQHVIYPHEIENIINELPGIVEVCVCGVPHNEAGHLPAAAIIKSSCCNLTSKEIYEYVAQRVSDEKNLRGGIYFTNFMPKTSTGKNLRFRVGNLCESLRRFQPASWEYMQPLECQFSHQVGVHAK